MSVSTILAQEEVKSALKVRWNLFLPGIISGALALVTLVYGYRKFLSGTSYEFTFATGWIAYAMVMAGVTASITVTVDLKLDRVRYLLSLPVTPRAIVISKMCGAATTALVVSVAMLALGNPMVLHLPLWQTLLSLGVLIFQALAVVGIICALSQFIDDLTKLGLMSSVASGVLHHLSSVNFPPWVFPVWIRPVIYANPITHSVNFIRSLVAGAPAYTDLLYLSAVSVTCIALGGWSLTKTLQKRMQ